MVLNTCYKVNLVDSTTAEVGHRCCPLSLTAMMMMTVPLAPLPVSIVALSAGTVSLLALEAVTGDN